MGFTGSNLNQRKLKNMNCIAQTSGGIALPEWNQTEADRPEDCDPSARRAGVANWLAVAALLMGTLAGRADDGFAGFTYRATPNSSILQLLSPDGLVFQWGEPAYGGFGEAELAGFPLGSPQPLPLPAAPDGARWVDASAAGFTQVLVDDTGRVFHLSRNPYGVSSLRPLPLPPAEVATWTRIQLLGNSILAQDAADELWLATIRTQWNQLLFGEWQRLDRPESVTQWIHWAAGSAIVALGDDGELYQAQSWLLGLHSSVAAPANEHWQRIPRPEGVNHWLGADTWTGQAAALGDDGEIYYWGMLLDPDNTRVFPGVHSHAWTLIHLPRPVEVARWTKVRVAHRAVMGVDEAGQYHGWGDNLGGLLNPAPDSPAFYQEFVPLPAPPAGGAWADVTFGERAAIARDATGKVYRWGNFRRLHYLYNPQPVIPLEAWELPVTLTDAEQRRRPFARLIQPFVGDQVVTESSVGVSVEAYAIAGELSELQLLVNGEPSPGEPHWTGEGGTLAQFTWTPDRHGEHLLEVSARDAAGRETVSPGVTVRSKPQVSWSANATILYEPSGDEPARPGVVTIHRSGSWDEPLEFGFYVQRMEWLDVEFEIQGARREGELFVVDFAVGQASAEVLVVPLADDRWESMQWTGLYASGGPETPYVSPTHSVDFQLWSTPPPALEGAIEITNAEELRFLVSGEPFVVEVRVRKDFSEYRPSLLLRSVAGQGGWNIHTQVLPDDDEYHYYRLHSEGEPTGDYQLAAYTWNAAGDPLLSPFMDLHVTERSLLPEVSLEAVHETVLEGDAPALPLVLRRGGDLSQSLTVGLTAAGTLTPGRDFEPLPANVTFRAGESELQLTMQILDDLEAERTEGLHISLTRPACTGLAGCYVVARGEGFKVRVLDDDAPEVVMPKARVLATRFGDSSMLFTASGQLYSWGDQRHGRLGHGQLYERFGGALPWPRMVALPAGHDRWTQVYLSEQIVLGFTDQGLPLAWGLTLRFSPHSQPTQWYPPMPATGLPTDLTIEGELKDVLLGRREDGRWYRLGMQGGNPPYLTTQLTSVQEISHAIPGDWLFTLFGEVWMDVVPFFSGAMARVQLGVEASHWEAIVTLDVTTPYRPTINTNWLALDNLGSLHHLQQLPAAYNSFAGRYEASFDRFPLPALPEDRQIVQILGNEIETLIQDTDGQLWRVDREAVLNQVPLAPESWVSVVPLPEGVHRWESVAVGRAHFLAIGDDGRVYAWGQNTFGQLGQGNLAGLSEPTRIPLFEGVNDPALTHPVVQSELSPVVMIRHPALELETTLDAPRLLEVVASAIDIDGEITRVAAVLDGLVVGDLHYDALRGFYVGQIATTPGVFALAVRAWDDSGLVSDSGVVTLTVIDPAVHPVVKVWNIPSATREGSSVPAQFVISRQGVADVPLTIHFDLQGTATEGLDYPALPRSVTIPAGAAEVRIPIYARPDFLDEPTEVIDLTLQPPPGCGPASIEPGDGCYTIGSPNTAPVFLLDHLVAGGADLPRVWLEVTQPFAREGTTNTARIEVRRTGPTAEALSVAYELGGEAQNGVDYNPLSGVAVIPAGAAHTPIHIVAIEDFVAEPIERVIVTLVDSGCDAGSGSAEGCYQTDARGTAVAYIGDKPVLPPPPPGLPGLNVTPRPVYFSGLELLPGQGTMLSLVSDPGVRFTLQVSSNLRAWRDLGELTCVSGHMDFLDVDAAQAPARYYRVVAAPEP
jgi:alpha-tubulin suppressor-like RCC1 family protein